MNKYVLIVLGLILFIVSGWVLFSQITKEAEEVVEEDELIMTEQYNCADEVVLNTLFMSDGESVQISLPNGRNFLLKSVESDSGFQFESPDGGLVFSVKGTSASIKMNGEILVDGCKAVLKENEEVNQIEEKETE